MANANDDRFLFTWMRIPNPLAVLMEYTTDENEELEISFVRKLLVVHSSAMQF